MTAALTTGRRQPRGLLGTMDVLDAIVLAHPSITVAQLAAALDASRRAYDAWHRALLSVEYSTEAMQGAIDVLHRRSAAWRAALDGDATSLACGLTAVLP